MSNRLLEEKGELSKIISSFSYEERFVNFKIKGMNEKVVIGVMSQSSEQTEVNKHYIYQTIFHSIAHVDIYMKKSLNEALEMIYQQDYTTFNPFEPANRAELEATYYVENAVFRSIILWDLLAQLYNEYHDSGLKPNNVYYKKLFRKNITEKLANKIHHYLEEDNKDGKMLDHHQFVSDYRNQMTHRSSPNITSLSSFARNMRIPMRAVIYRVIKDYESVSLFIDELLGFIDSKHMK